MQEKYTIYRVEGEIFKANERFPNIMVFNLFWEADSGFGELEFSYNTETKEWECDDECMSKEFCSAVLNRWLDDIYGKK